MLLYFIYILIWTGKLQYVISLNVVKSMNIKYTNLIQTRNIPSSTAFVSNNHFYIIFKIDVRCTNIRAQRLDTETNWHYLLSFLLLVFTPTLNCAHMLCVHISLIIYYQNYSSRTQMLLRVNYHHWISDRGFFQPAALFASRVYKW